MAREVLALVHKVLIRDQFGGSRRGRLKLTAGRLVIRRRRLAIVGLIALARRYGLNDEYCNRGDIKGDE